MDTLAVMLPGHLLFLWLLFFPAAGSSQFRGLARAWEKAVSLWLLGDGDIKSPSLEWRDRNNIRVIKRISLTDKNEQWRGTTAPCWALAPPEPLLSMTAAPASRTWLDGVLNEGDLSVMFLSLRHLCLSVASYFLGLFISVLLSPVVYFHGVGVSGLKPFFAFLKKCFFFSFY